MDFPNFKNQHICWNIYTGVNRLESDTAKLCRASYSFPADLAHERLYDGMEIQHAQYLVESVENIYISEILFYWDWLAKLAHLVNFNYWSPDADNPGPFREFLRPNEYITLSNAKRLSNDFLEWDEQARHLADTKFYRIYCTVHVFVRRCVEVGSASEKMILAALVYDDSDEPPENSISYPNYNILESSEYDEEDI